ncbi:complement resistance protein TraT [Vibrio mediterranei]|uniref:complement resistance protein TraT n=2 Tax=Vibrio mediterranei TaxID=689 RepID=UPI001EFCC4B3|nr:complement resistance protein TraT [Vibrio mediterranei]MCG9658257.1 complement resistance protein TraT [Vibrio mediterranei]
MYRPSVRVLGLTLLTSTVLLSGCSAMSTAIKKRNLDVQTKMSQTIWLDPVPESEHTVYLQVRNTTDKTIPLAETLKTDLQQRGYQVLTDPQAAHYWLQVNILKMDKMDLKASQQFLGMGYGGGLAGGAIGALAASGMGYGGGDVVTAGLVGGAIGFVADTMVEDVNYALITDVRVVEKTQGAVTTEQKSQLTNGIGGSTTSVEQKTENKHRYQTRILSTANKVNLDFDEAKPALVKGLSHSLTGVF